jgi:hypothetical protein
MNKYPIYIPSKGRADSQKTVRLLEKNGINNYYVVVEHKEYHAYCDTVEKSHVLRMKGDNYGTSSAARNFAIEHSKKSGFAKHWQMDDDISTVYEHDKGKRLTTTLPEIFATMEKETDKLPLVGIVGMRTANFLKDVKHRVTYNTSLTSLYLITNTGVRFRGIMYVDMDFELQLLKKGMKTIKYENFVFVFQTPMKHPGGYCDTYKDDKKRMEAIDIFFKNNPDIKLEVHRNPQGFLAIKNFGSVWRKYKN